MICINTAKHYFVILCYKSKKNDKPKKLLEQIKDQINLRHYSRRTEESYIHWIKRIHLLL